MQEHFCFTDSQMEKLSKKGIGVKDLFYFVDFFKAKTAPISKVSLFHYVDNCGNPFESKEKSAIVAIEIFESLSAPDKIEFYNYLDFIENGSDCESE